MSSRSSPQQWVVVGSYGPPEAATVHICAFDEPSGDLRVVGSVSGLANPSFLTMSPSGRHLYAVSETALGSHSTPGSVFAFELTRRDLLELAPLSHRPSGGDHPCHLCIDGEGRWLAVSNYGSGSVAVLPIRTDGSLGEVASLVQHAGAGPHPERQDGPHVHSTTFMPGGRFLVAADLGIDRLLVYAFDSRTGSLSPHGETISRPGAGPRHLALHPDGAHLFVVNELDNTITAYGWDAAAGALDELATLPTLPPDPPPNLAADLAVAADGRHVYVSNRGHDSVAVFAFERGRLSRPTLGSSGGAWPRGVGLSAAGSYLFSANQHADHVAVLPLRPGGAAVGHPIGRTRIQQPTCVAVVGADA